MSLPLSIVTTPIGRRSCPGDGRIDRSKTRRRALAAAVLVLGALACDTGRAQSAPAVPDPQEWLRLSPQQQAERREDLRARLQQATPAQRQAFREALRERLHALTPEQRERLVETTRERWSDMSPEQRERIAAERRERIRAMTPAERRELLRQRRAILDRLSPEERDALREKLPVR